MAHFTSLVGNIAQWLELPSPQLVSQWKSHFPMRWWCNVLSLVISQGPFTVEEGRADMLTASLLETIISAGSIVRPTPWLAECTHCLYGWGVGGGGMCGQLHQGKSEQHTQPRWMIACCVRHSAPRSEMQFLRRTSGWMLSSSGGCSCRQHTDESTELVQPSGTSCSEFFSLSADSQNVPRYE